MPCRTAAAYRAAARFDRPTEELKERTVTDPAPQETEEVGKLGMWTLGAIGGFFLAFWLGFIILLAGSGPEAVSFPDGGSPPEVPGGPTDGVTVTAIEFAFDPVPGTATSGDIELVLRNEGLVFHNLEILTAAGEPVPGFILEAEAGQQDSGSTTLTAGEYLLICSIPGHRDAGMEASLTVTG